jgi:hypothetical protein
LTCFLRSFHPALLFIARDYRRNFIFLLSSSSICSCAALLAERSTFLQSVFEMVKCQSQRTRLNVGSTVCNLIACPNSTSMMINSGALGVLKIIATIDNQGESYCCIAFFVPRVALPGLAWPRLALPRLALPCPASPRVALPRLASPRLASPRLA